VKILDPQMVRDQKKFGNRCNKTMSEYNFVVIELSGSSETGGSKFLNC